MLADLYLTVVDYDSGALLPGVIVSLISIKDNSILATKTSDAGGKITFNIEEGVYNYTAFKSGYTGVKDGLYLSYPRAGYQIRLKTATNSTQPPALPVPQPTPITDIPGVPLPLPQNNELAGSVGTRCDILHNYTFSSGSYAYRDRYTGASGPYNMDRNYVIGQANKDPMCFKPRPPTPAEWQNDIQSQITNGINNLTKYINDVNKTVVGQPGPAGPMGPPGPAANNDLIVKETSDRIAETGIIKQSIDVITSTIKTVQTDIKTALDGLYNTLDGRIKAIDAAYKAGQASLSQSIDERIKGLDSSLKAGLDGIWIKLETWLIDNILRVLEKALDSETMRRS